MPTRRKPDPLVTQIGQRLRALRLEREMSLEQMTWGAGLSGKGHLSQAERGLALPTLTTLARVAQCLGVSLVDLVNLADGGPRSALIEATRRLSVADLERLLAAALACTPLPKPPGGLLGKSRRRKAASSP